MHTDVAIVGGGPAGAWAARSLASRGARVTMFDPSHPREKPCGGGVTGRALDLVGDAIDPALCPRTTIRSARFITTPVDHAGRARSDAVVALDADALIVASRAAFDAALVAAAQRAGATLARARVRDVIVEATGVRIETTSGTERADFVIGADGANSLVRRRVMQPFDRGRLSIATGLFAHGVTSDEIAIEFIDHPPGYIWSFPRPDHLAIGICAPADAGHSGHALRARTAEWIARNHLADGARLEPYSWPIPSLRTADFKSIQVAGDRWCLVGDAAGLVDPITREGIYFALASAEWAAESLVGGRGSQSYPAHLRDGMIGELAAAASLSARFFQPRFTALMIEALDESARIRRVMADLIAGRQRYATLRWRLLTTLEFGLALRALRSSGGL